MSGRALCFAMSLVVIFVAVVTVSFSVSKTTTAVSQEPALSVGPIDQSGISADAYLVFDLKTGETLVSHNEGKVRPIASVTKLFTAAVVLEQLPLEATTTVTFEDVATEGRAGKLKPFEEYSFRDLLWPLLLESSNDAAATLERANPELIKKMNELTASLSLPNTHFADASGLSAENQSTVAELAVLTDHLYKNDPHLFDITQLPQYIGDQTGWVNTSPFVEVSEYRGGKHGFTPEANRTGVSVFAEKLNKGADRLLGYVVLGSDNLATDIEVLRERVRAATSLQ